MREFGGALGGQYPNLKKDHGIDCSLGYECSARYLNAGINEMYAEGMREVWDKNGLKDVLAK